MMKVIIKTTFCILIAGSILQGVIRLALRACVDRIIVLQAGVGSVEIELDAIGKELVDILVVRSCRARLIIGSVVHQYPRK